VSQGQGRRGTDSRVCRDDHIKVVQKGLVTHPVGPIVLQPAGKGMAKSALASGTAAEASSSCLFDCTKRQQLREADKARYTEQSSDNIVASAFDQELTR
jgi:hypothetical protein